MQISTRKWTIDKYQSYFGTAEYEGDDVTDFGARPNWLEGCLQETERNDAIYLDHWTNDLRQVMPHLWNIDLHVLHCV